MQENLDCWEESIRAAILLESPKSAMQVLHKRQQAYSMILNLAQECYPDILFDRPQDEHQTRSTSSVAGGACQLATLAAFHSEDAW